MPKSHFDEILDYGLFEQEEYFNTSRLPTDIDWSKYKYFTKVKTADNSILTFRSKSSSLRPNINDIGFHNNDRIQDGYFPLANGGWVLHIENGFLKNWLRMVSFRDPRKKVNFEVETIFPFGVQKGNRVFIEGKPALDGRYYTSHFGTININDSKVVDEVDSETVVFRPSAIFQFLWSIVGLTLSTIAAISLYNILQGPIPTKEIETVIGFTFLSILFLGIGIATIFNALFYRLAIDENSFSIGSFLNHKTVMDQEVKGVCFLSKKMKRNNKTVHYKLPVIVKKNKLLIPIAPHRVSVDFEQVEAELLKKYYLFSPEESAEIKVIYDKSENERFKGCLFTILIVALFLGFIIFIMQLAFMQQ